MGCKQEVNKSELKKTMAHPGLPGIKHFNREKLHPISNLPEIPRVEADNFFHADDDHD